MAGEISTFAFDDDISSCHRSKDRGVSEVSRALSNIHDDFIDHPISVGSDAWEALRRIVAFLGTDLEIGNAKRRTPWPFVNEQEWQANECLLNSFNLPSYDPAFHGRQVNRWWNRIPSSIGFLVLAALLAAGFIAIALL